MERLRRIKRRIKHLAEEPQDMAKLYENLQHGRCKPEEVESMGSGEKLLIELVKEGDVEQFKKHLEVRNIKLKRRILVSESWEQGGHGTGKTGNLAVNFSR